LSSGPAGGAPTVAAAKSRASNMRVSRQRDRLYPGKLLGGQGDNIVTLQWLW